MRITRFLRPDGSPTSGVLLGDSVVDLADHLPQDQPDLSILRLEPSEILGLAERVPHHRRFSLDDVRLLAPIARPGKVLAVARGYQRAQEPTVADDGVPYVFLKRSDGILGPSDPIVLGPPATAVVPEIEIALVVGKRTRDIPVGKALESIAGYTIANDISARQIDHGPPGRRDPDLDRFLDWLNGKWLDGYLALGPVIVTPDEWSDNGNRRLETRVSTTPTVSGSTAQLLHGFDETVSFTSRLMTLQPGDVILTGMPETPKPERHLVAGDFVEGEVDGLGILANPVVETGDSRTAMGVSNE